MKQQGLRQRSSKQDAKKSSNTKEHHNFEDDIDWTWIIFFRILNSLLVFTFFNPDEFWQSLEVAHNMVFNYGHLTWEWREALRSYLHPLIFAVLYKILDFLHLDYAMAVIYGPRVLQGLFAAIGDICIVKMSIRLFGWLPSKYIIAMLQINWFMFYCIVRTYSNSMEAVLVCVALYFNSTTGRLATADIPRSGRFLCYLVAGICFIIRPTSAVLFATLAVYQFLLLHGRQKFEFVVDAIFIAAICLGSMLAIDSHFYGRFVIVSWNFFKFNLVQDVASIYGTHPWHWYFTQGFPAILGPSIPFCLYGLYLSMNQRHQHARVSFLLISVYAFVFSILAHKEFRFMLPLLPLMLMYGGYAMFSVYHQFKLDRKSFTWKLCVAFLLLNVPMAFYFSVVHQRGTVSVMYYLQDLGENQSVHFLMPCHATPFYSHVHKNISMDFWDCSPRDEPGYIDDSDRFRMDPGKFTADYYFGNSSSLVRKLPSHFVLYDDYLPKLQAFFDKIGYTKVANFFHSIGWNEVEQVIVFAQSSNSTLF